MGDERVERMRADGYDGVSQAGTPVREQPSGRGLDDAGNEWEAWYPWCERGEVARVLGEVRPSPRRPVKGRRGRIGEKHAHT